MRTGSYSLIALLFISTFALPLGAAAPDNNVEWDGISHYALLDRTPACPLSGQSFALRMQSWDNDLTAVRVRLDDGGVSYYDAALVGSRGPYDVWEATVPAPSGSTIEFLFEVTDG
ncbi:MAG: hypothetical protein GF405_10170, partial [Candidatus Eisenbacteria bacterium]|nr:hypothetical protein [Candidatus Eisenbacteria bacterium]